MSATELILGLPHTTVILFCLLLILEIQKASSLKCWDCNSGRDPNCGDPFKNHTIALADCNQKFLPHYPDLPGKICRKITQKVASDTRVIRSCGYLETEASGNCIMRAGTFKVFMHYCHCDSGDGCNVAISNTGTSFLLFTALVLVGLLS